MTITLNGSEGITLNNGSADGAQVTLSSSGYSNWNLDNYSGRLRAYYGSTEYFTINTSGNVGIGTSSPSAKLDVSGAGPVSIRINDINTNSWDITNNSYLSFSRGGTERARIDSSGQMWTTNGAGSVAKAYDCRAWVNFNGTGTVAINASGNVSSITDNGTGYYSVNFTTSMPDGLYAAVTCAENGAVSGTFGSYAYTRSTSYVSLYTFIPTGSATDARNADVAIFR